MSAFTRLSVKDKSFKDFLITDDFSIIDAIKSLNVNKKIVYVISSKNNELVGSMTDGDVRRSLLSGQDVNESISCAMNKKTHFLYDNSSDQDCLNLLKENKISSAPILDSNKNIIEFIFISNNSEGAKYKNHDFDKSALIMAGGFGTRLMPLTSNCPKPMLPINNKPMLELIINNLIKHDFKKIYISVHYLADQIKDYFGDGKKFNIEIDYLEEEKPLGTAGCLDGLRKKITNPFLVMNGDIITSVDFNGLMSFHLNQESDATMVVRPQEIKSDFGVVSTKDLEIVGFEEKPVYVSYINTGIYILNSNIFSYLDGDKKDMPDLFLDMQKNGLKTVAYPMHEDWKDIGNINEYNEIKNAKI
tara:strand:- start:1204 stop:2283 length:1080 start_codon:yes stop_codon:yes gene_type:complete